MKKTKGTGAMLFSMIAVIVIICLFIVAGNGAKKEAASKEIRVGLLLYRGDDTFISTLRSYIEEKAKEYERKEGIKVTLDILDAKSNQNTQNNQVDRMLELGCDALCVNIVDRFAASVVIDKAMAADVPVIFFNREPVEEDMNRWEKLYYVGADAKDSAVFDGRILVDAYKKDSCFCSQVLSFCLFHCKHAPISICCFYVPTQNITSFLSIQPLFEKPSFLKIFYQQKQEQVQPVILTCLSSISYNLNLYNEGRGDLL